MTYFELAKLLASKDPNESRALALRCFSVMERSGQTEDAEYIRHWLDTVPRARK